MYILGGKVVNLSMFGMGFVVIAKLVRDLHMTNLDFFKI